MFKVVEYPSSVPTANLENSYIKQNEILNHAKYLYTAFGGIILANIETGNTSRPYILAGSVCLFCETLFYTSEDIELVESSNETGMSFIALSYNVNTKTLECKIESYKQGSFDAKRGEIYFYSEGLVKKYLNFSMYHKDGAYYSKSYIEQEQS